MAFLLDFIRFLRRERLAAFCLVVVAGYLALAAGMEGYSIYCSRNGLTPFYQQGEMAERFLPPSRRHWLGTDYQGRDVFWRAAAAARVAVKVGVLASLLASFIGVALGVLSGYFGGVVDDIIVWLYSTFASIPTLLFILAFALLVNKGFVFPPLKAGFDTAATLLNTEPGMLSVYLGIGLTGWVGLCRVARAETMRLRGAAFVQAARALGYGDFRILARHIVPNLAHLVIIYFSMRFAYAILTEVIVSYLGLGVGVEPSWGTMIADGQERLWQGIWWEVAAATLFMFFLVCPLHLLGDSLRDYLDPRSRG